MASGVTLGISSRLPFVKIVEPFPPRVTMNASTPCASVSIDLPVRSSSMRAS